MKRPLHTVYDPIEDTQHIGPPPFADQATLCGQTDWSENVHAHKPPEKDTPRQVNCNLCKWIFDFCNSGTWPKGRP